MAEFSFPWPYTTAPEIGDGRNMTAAEFATFLMSFFGDGVLKGVDNELEVTSPGANQIQVDTGVGLVAGHAYFNSSALALAPDSASAGTTRKDSVIMECDWTGGGATEQYTVRIVTKEGSAASYPTMTETINVLWQARLYNYDINDAGVISNIDAQFDYAAFRTEVLTAMCAAGLLSADAAGRALMATDYFDAATILAKIATGAFTTANILSKFPSDSFTNAVLLQLVLDGAFQADAATRALFADGIWPNAKLASDCKRIVGEIMENGAATLGGTDGRRMVVSGTAYESWVHCDGGASVNGVTIPDYRNRVLAGASATHATGTTGGSDTADLSHAHSRGSLTNSSENSHTHQLSVDLGGNKIDDTTGTWSSVTGPGTAHTHSIVGTTDDALSATQDMRQATAYVYRFIYVG